jgi:hypothetical protein
MTPRVTATPASEVELQMTRILNPLEHVDGHPAIEWFEFLAIHLEESLGGFAVGNGYLGRAAVDYVALLQRQGRSAADDDFFVFEEKAVHARMVGLVDCLHESTFDHTFDEMLSLFKAQCFQLMCAVAPAMTALSDCRDFTTISNTYVDVARRLPRAAGVYYGFEGDGSGARFPTVVKPTLFNRFNHGMRLRDYPTEDFAIAVAEIHLETTRRLHDEGRIDLNEDEVESLFESTQPSLG